MKNVFWKIFRCGWQMCAHTEISYEGE